MLINNYIYMESIKNIIFTYSNIELVVVLDNYNKPWFNIIQICNILKYKNPKNIIYKLVEKEYIKKLKNILDNYKIYLNAQPESIYINEYGLYALLLRSGKKQAKRFYKWVIEDVLPSIRNKGFYELELENKKKIDEFNKQIEYYNNLLEKKELRIKILENNQSSKHINNNGNYIIINMNI